MRCGPLLVAICFLAPLWPAAARAENLLAGRQPQRAVQAEFPERITDGRIAAEGADWQGPAAARLASGASVEWDLGEVVAFEQAAVQADNNDDYLLLVSEDGLAFHEVWRAGATGSPGLATRSGAFPPARGRYIRLEAQGGDGRYSVSELELFRAGGGTSGSALLRVHWLPAHPLDAGWLLWVCALGLALALTHARSPRPWVLACAAPLLAAALWLLHREREAGQIDAARIDWLRAMVAIAAALAVARELWSRWPAHRAFTRGALALCAVLGVLCFGNLARPQFHDAGRERPTWLHYYDLRTYYPMAKYFAELRYDGIYAASAAALAEDRGGLDAIAAMPLRDLRTHELSTVGKNRAHIEAVRARFRPERWASFRRDVDYFRAGMGDGFAGSMSDHGGNATPVWFLGARLLFGSAAAADAVMWRAVILDLLLLALAFASLGWAYGPRTMLVALTVFGATDFYQFGSNWLGAPLRHDWLSLWCLAVSALKLRRHWLAGGLLAWATLIRAFPALAFAAIAAIPLSALLGQLRREGRRLSLRAWASGQRDVIHIAAGALVAGLLLLLLSGALFDFGAWADWLHKAWLLNRDNHVNNLSLRTHVIDDPRGWALGALAGSACVLFAARRATPDAAAALGVLLVPLVFNPANYYLHCVCILPALAGEEHGKVARAGVLLWLVLLGMCALSYVTSLTSDLNAHFRADTWVMLSAMGLVLALQFVRPRSRAQGP